MNILFLTLTLFCGVILADKEQFLQFVPTLPSEAQQIYFQSPGHISPIEVDATWPHQVRVRIVAILNGYPELKLHCHVAPLDSDSELTFAGLCSKPSLNVQQQCIDPKDQTPTFGEVEFDAIGNRSAGYTFKTNLPVGKHLLDSFYFCKFRNKRGELVSNMVEIQDVYYYHKQFVTREIESSPKTLSPLTAAKLPLRLECGKPVGVEQKLPEWADQSFPSPFRWSFCDMSSTSEFTAYSCLSRARTVRVSDYFENVVYPNGTLFLLSRTPAAWRSMGLLCVSDARPATIFSVFFGGTQQNPSSLQYDSSAPYPSGHQIKPLSPPYQTLDIRKGPNDITQLTAVYQANMRDVQYKWTKDGEPLPFDFLPPTAFILTMPKIICTNYSGVYTLQVTDGFSSAQFIYKVNVVGPPVVLVPPPSVLFVMEGNDAKFQCAIENFNNKFLYINGQNLLHDSTQSKEYLVEQFPYLKDVIIQPLLSHGSQMQYRASNLLYPTGSQFGPTHTVTITVSNKYGTASVSTLVVVLPRPRIIDSPAKYLCGPPCLNTVAHAFDCKLDLAPYRMTHVDQTWDFNGADVSTLSSLGDLRSEYLRVEGTRLHLSPVRDQSAVSLFANSNATCRLRIYSQAIRAAAGSDGSAFPNAKSLVYDSRQDVKRQPLLTTEINMILDTAANTNTSSISWIAAVIIAVMLLIAVGVLIACLVMRGRGETYLLDKEERALGNDPEKELRDHEAFRTYERSEEPLLRGSKCSLNDDSAEIGSDADGELDDYNLDPGKFNEEGSFIDQYATETRYKGASRLPTLPRSQEPQL